MICYHDTRDFMILGGFLLLFGAGAEIVMKKFSDFTDRSHPTTAKMPIFPYQFPMNSQFLVHATSKIMPDKELLKPRLHANENM